LVQNALKLCALDVINNVHKPTASSMPMNVFCHVSALVYWHATPWGHCCQHAGYCHSGV